MLTTNHSQIADLTSYNAFIHRTASLSTTKFTKSGPKATSKPFLPSSNEIGHYSGLANGNAIYTQDYPDDHSVCYTDDGREFTIEGGCSKQARKFKCICNIAGDPETCEVKDKDGNSLGTSEGQTDTTFIGIAITQDSSCVVEFGTEVSEDCPTDNDLHVTFG
ncbi:hypothetical protein FALBO_14900 [Fusarium albosuccineum]|uniref:Uncharacterized protein n=1 Tax=Fusarium albosuccineum TaxID=1237068 RepID=A0A8H4KZQ0_9HYPO|nr:hypothetical protein FALBO_14900 [Fusarium albosuccineum]